MTSVRLTRVIDSSAVSGSSQRLTITLHDQGQNVVNNVLHLEITSKEPVCSRVELILPGHY